MTQRHVRAGLLRGVLTSAAAVLIGLLSGCARGPSREATEPRHPLILFAVDGLDWDVVAPLLAAGRLPVMRGLMNEGTYGYLESMKPTFSPVVWTSVATGKVPAKHGIKNFIYETRENTRREYRYYTSGHRRTKAVWNILSDYGLVVHTVGWWMTFPAESVNGVMVSQTNTRGVLKNPKNNTWKGSLLKGVDGQVHPPERQNRVMELLDRMDTSLDRITEDVFGSFPNPPDAFGQRIWNQSRWAFRADATYIEVALDILESNEPFDLLMVYVGGPDVSGHRFWRYAYPDEFDNPPSPEQIDNFAEIIDDCYAYVDRSIGRILRAAPEGAAVMIVSDHGMDTNNQDGTFEADAPPERTNSAHHYDAPAGVFIAAGPNVSVRSRDETGGELIPAALESVGGVLDVAPTVLALKGVPLGEDLDGEPMTRVLSPEWFEKARTRRIPTHDTPEWLAARSQRQREAIDESERLEQLRSLGYID